MNEMNALTPTNNNLVVFFKRNYFRLPQGGVFTVHSSLRKKSEIKRSSSLSTLQTGSFRKGALRFRFVASILLERIYLKLLTNKYSFISSFHRCRDN